MSENNNTDNKPQTTTTTTTTSDSPIGETSTTGSSSESYLTNDSLKYARPNIDTTESDNSSTSASSKQMNNYNEIPKQQESAMTTSSSREFTVISSITDNSNNGSNISSLAKSHSDIIKSTIPESIIASEENDNDSPTGSAVSSPPSLEDNQGKFFESIANFSSEKKPLFASSNENLETNFEAIAEFNNASSNDLTVDKLPLINDAITDTETSIWSQLSDDKKQEQLRLKFGDYLRKNEEMIGENVKGKKSESSSQEEEDGSQFNDIDSTNDNVINKSSIKLINEHDWIEINPTKEENDETKGSIKENDKIDKQVILIFKMVTSQL
jgi:hypothetical protein